MGEGDQAVSFQAMDFVDNATPRPQDFCGVDRGPDHYGTAEYNAKWSQMLTALAAYMQAKGWQDKGGKVLGTSKAVPIKHVIASPKLSAEQASAVREYLLALDSSDDGKKKLEPTKWKGFAAYDSAQLMALGTWLGL